MSLPSKDIPQASQLEQALNFISDSLQQAQLHYGQGTAEPDEEAVLLACHVLKRPPFLDQADLHQAISAEQWAAMLDVLRQRIEGRTPLAYLINQAWFASLPFYVDTRVIIPRSPIAELILQGLQPWLGERTLHTILDVCTGSGCIALALAQQFSQAQVDGLDLSPQALEVAQINGQRLQLQDRVQWLQSDMFAALPPKRYDLIISNPPYVPESVMDALPAEFSHEPRDAFIAGSQGFECVDRILQEASQFLTEDGLLIVEVGLIMDAVQQRYPELPFIWLDFEHGGEGVFLLYAAHLSSITAITRTST